MDADARTRGQAEKGDEMRTKALALAAVLGSLARGGRPGAAVVDRTHRHHTEERG